MRISSSVFPRSAVSAFLLLAALGVSGATESDSSVLNLLSGTPAAPASISAELVQRDPSDPKRAIRARVEHSDLGLRLIRGRGRDRKILLQNYRRGKRWLIDPSRLVTHTLEFPASPLAPKSGEPLQTGMSDGPPLTAPELEQEREPDFVLAATSAPSSVLAPMPCLGASRFRSAGQRRWRGRKSAAPSRGAPRMRSACRGYWSR